MNFLVVYDVDTTTREGQRRLRRVAKACEGYGQRVQFSVFEVACSQTSMAQLVIELHGIINASLDSIRVYPLDRESWARVVLIGRRRELPNESAWVL